MIISSSTPINYSSDPKSNYLAIKDSLTNDEQNKIYLDALSDGTALELGLGTNPANYPLQARFQPVNQRSFYIHDLNIANDKSEYKMSTEVKKIYNGNYTSDDVKKLFTEFYNERVEINVKYGVTDGKTPQDNAEIFKQSYIQFYNQVLSQAIMKCNENGAAHITNTNLSYTYYDADLYYMSEDLIGLLDSAYEDISKTENFRDIKPPEIIQENKNFNEYWRKYIGHQTVVLKDTSMKPPQGFTLFFQDNKYSYNDYKFGEMIALSATDPNAITDQAGSVTWYIKIPKGAQLLKMDKMLELGAFTSRGIGVNPMMRVIDINSLISDDETVDLFDRVKRFYDEYINNFNEGVLRIGIGDWVKEADVPFDVHAKGKPIDKFKANDLITVDGSIPNCEDINQFVNNFVIFAPFADKKAHYSYTFIGL